MSSGPPPLPPPGGQVVNPTLGKDREKLPGWNDPPELTDARSSARTKLNKRVGYPPPATAVASMMASGPPPSTGSYVMPLSTPPMVQADLPPPPPPISKPDADGPDTHAAPPNQHVDSEAAIPGIDAVMCQLNSVLDDLGSGPDIRKRVAAMHTKWDTLDDRVKSGVGQLAAHLEVGNYEEAERVQKSLAVSYPSQCSAWIVAFKRIVHDSKAKRGSAARAPEEQSLKDTGYMVPANN